MSAQLNCPNHRLRASLLGELLGEGVTALALVADLGLVLRVELAHRRAHL